MDNATGKLCLKQKIANWFHQEECSLFPDFHISFEAQRLNAGPAVQSNKSEKRLVDNRDEINLSILCIPAEIVSNSKTFLCSRFISAL